MPKIYTKTGDKGTSSLVSGRRISKADLTFEAYGTVDELNSAMGMLYRYTSISELKKEIHYIQNVLFNIGAIMARDGAKLSDYPIVDDEAIALLEEWIDRMDADLEPLRNFILPGGGAAGSWAHMCRTICRRAERRVVAIEDEDFTVEVMYLNRLSDYLFVLSRYENKQDGHTELSWDKTPAV